MEHNTARCNTLDVLSLDYRLNIDWYGVYNIEVPMNFGKCVHIILRLVNLLFSRVIASRGIVCEMYFCIAV